MSYIPNTYTVPDYPTEVAPESYDLTSVTSTTISVTQALKKSATSRGGQRWAIKFYYAPLTRQQFTPIWCFLIKQRGMFGDFTIALPNLQSRGVLTTQGTTVPQIKTAVSRGNQITIKNFTANTQKIIAQGDYFRIGNSPKVYIVGDDVQSNPNGDVTITTYPNLVQPIETNDVVYFEPIFNVSMVTDSLFVNVPKTTNSNFSVDFVETLGNTGNAITY